MNQEKRDLRREVRQKLNSLSPEVLREETLKTAGRLVSHPCFYQARVVLAYRTMSTSPEFDTAALLNEILINGKILGLPRLNNREAQLTEDRGMSFLETSGLDGPWELHPLGMEEPPADSPLIRPEDYAPGEVLLILPGTAYDSSGGRLGKGGGYYDTYLKEHAGAVFTAAPALNCQIVEHIPREAHDLPVDIIFYPQGEFYGNH
jgi:5-formyltetrahydrofolate cyclo-ligase